MDGLRHICKIYAALLLAFSFFATSCSEDTYEEDGFETGNTVAVKFDIGMFETSSRGFVNDGQHNINRILAIPFVKSNETYPNVEAYFNPRYDLAKQIDVESFPVYNLSIHLPENSTYTIMVIGYNKNDFDFYNPTDPNNKFELVHSTTPQTLSNLNVSLKETGVSPEIFSCQCTAYQGTASKGSYFMPEEGYKLEGTLKRIFSGLSVEVTSIPPYIKKLTLRAQKLTKTTKLTNGNIVDLQAPAQGFTLGSAAPVNGTVAFEMNLLPIYHSSITSYKTKLYIDVEYGAFKETYTVKNIQGVTIKDEFTFQANQATNFYGPYSKVNLGFEKDITINLDDDEWDGLH